MKERVVEVTAIFDMSNIHPLRITSADKVADIVQKAMLDYFGQDEGFDDLIVKIYDN